MSNGQIPNLDELAQARAMAEAGVLPFPVAVTNLVGIGQQMLAELSGIRRAVMPTDIKLHIPTLVPAFDDESSELIGYLTFCHLCSEMANEFVQPCQLVDTTNWPPSFLVAGDVSKLTINGEPVQLPDQTPGDASGPRDADGDDHAPGQPGGDDAREAADPRRPTGDGHSQPEG